MKQLIITKYYKHKDNLHNLFWRLFQVFAKQGISFLIFILSAKQLIPYEFGLYSYILGIAYILVFLGDFGISSATSKYVAEYSVKDKERVKSVLFNSGLIIFITTLIILGIAFLIGKIYFQEKYIYLVYLLPVIIFSPLTSMYDGIYRGLKKFKSLAVMSIIVGVISLSFVYFLIQNYGLMGAFASQSLFYFLLFLFLALGYRDFNFKMDIDIMKEIGKYSLIIGLGSVGTILYSKIDVIFLGHYGFITEAGYYEIANKILMLLIIPFAILGQIIAPDVTKYYTAGNHEKVMGKFMMYLKFSFIVSLFLVIIIFFTKEHSLSLFLNNYNTPEMIMILTFMLFIYFTEMINTMMVQGFIVPTGHARINTYLLLSFGFIHVILNFILLNLFGFIGIVYSIIIINVLKDIILISIYYEVLRKEQSV